MQRAVDEVVVVGKVLDTFGLGGELKVLPEDYFLESLRKVLFKKKGGDYEEFEVEYWERLANLYVLKIKGVDDLERAKDFVGAKIFCYSKDLPPLREEEFYLFELTKMEVYTQGGEYLGRITGILETPSYQLVEVGSRYLIPFTSYYVLEVNRKENRIIVREEVVVL